VHLDLGEMSEAAPLLERAVALGASDRDVLHNLAVAWVRLGRLDDAGRLLARLLAREPGFARAHNALGLLNERRGDLAAARDAFAAAARLAPDDAGVARNLARAEEGLGRIAAACATLERSRMTSEAARMEWTRLGCTGQ